MIDLNIKVRIKTLVGGNIGEYLHDFHVDKDLDRAQKGVSLKKYTQIQLQDERLLPFKRGH